MSTRRARANQENIYGGWQRWPASWVGCRLPIPTTVSRPTWRRYYRGLVFGTVISDAAMVDRVIGMDVREAAAARDRVPRRDRGMGERPRRREIEGIGGRLWYELGH